MAIAKLAPPNTLDSSEMQETLSLRFLGAVKNTFDKTIDYWLTGLPLSATRTYTVQVKECMPFGPDLDIVLGGIPDLARGPAREHHGGAAAAGAHDEEAGRESAQRGKVSSMGMHP